jgi:hypothetical protein
MHDFRKPSNIRRGIQIWQAFNSTKPWTRGIVRFALKKETTREMRTKEEAAAEKATTFFMKLFNLVQGGVELAEGRVVLHLCSHTRASIRNRTPDHRPRSQKTIAAARTYHRGSWPWRWRTPTGAPSSPRCSGSTAERAPYATHPHGPSRPRRHDPPFPRECAGVASQASPRRTRRV